MKRPVYITILFQGNDLNTRAFLFSPECMFQSWAVVAAGDKEGGLEGCFPKGNNTMLESSSITNDAKFHCYVSFDFSQS